MIWKKNSICGIDNYLAVFPSLLFSIWRQKLIVHVFFVYLILLYSEVTDIQHNRRSFLQYQRIQYDIQDQFQTLRIFQTSAKSREINWFIKYIPVEKIFINNFLLFGITPSSGWLLMESKQNKNNKKLKVFVGLNTIVLLNNPKSVRNALILRLYYQFSCSAGQSSWSFWSRWIRIHSRSCSI